MATEQELAAVIALRKDELLGGASSAAILAKEYGGGIEHLPASELRTLADRILSMPPVAAAFIKPTTAAPVNPVAEAVLNHRAHLNLVGLQSGVSQGMGAAPLPPPPGYQPPPAPGQAPAGDAPIDLNARSMVGHLQTLNSVNRSGFTPFGKAR